ncbi:hypothetical protein ONS95_005155 [Cadophora gregata]|uniref:uncharacterized protein n=1 Tax=Cadophora gregata TaxID=51156 RepID=UPI0026DB5819|nr:uncharacterized protein ONS95_005155 [Cadophora gregata]KAK0104890.1 hypothetical protein ONS95_005155 [Cadophora gregata]
MIFISTALPRRPTRGPLDINDAPISPSSPLSTTTTTPKLNKAPSSLLSPTQSQYLTPRLPSPGPGSNLSNLSSPSFRTAKTSLSPSRSNMSGLTTSASASCITSKDFSFLLRPEIYHPLTLLDVPPPFRVTSSQVDPLTPLNALISSGHFRAAAIKAASILTSTSNPISPSDHIQIFDLVYTRLASLTLCNQTTLAAQEVKALEDLNSAYYRDENDGSHLVPWELRVLAVRLQGMGFNDARRGVVGYYDLAREARLVQSSLKKSRREMKAKSLNSSANIEGAESDESQGDGEVDQKIGEVDREIQLWENRLAELGIRVASALIEMEDLEGATRFLASLTPPQSTSSPSSSSSSHLAIQKALLWLCIGDVEAARSCVIGAASGSENDQGRISTWQKVILALANMADSEFERAVEGWRALIEGDGEVEGGDDGVEREREREREKAMWRQNLGVCYLYLGRMDEARTLLESLISTSHSFHALTFNLSTIYELCTERSRALKIGLAEKVAAMYQDGGDERGGGREGGSVGWEKVNGDFKL